jgi:hypothetical protein
MKLLLIKEMGYGSNLLNYFLTLREFKTLGGLINFFNPRQRNVIAFQYNMSFSHLF